MTCPSCGAPMQLKPGMDSFRCEYCRSIHIPERNDDGVRVLADQDDQAVQSCPICSTPLKLASIDRFRILYCVQCHGMLVAMAQFQVLIDDLRALQRDTLVQTFFDREDLRRSINCPQCRRAMEAHLYAGAGNVVIDSCDRCCLNWLDHGELMRIVQALDERTGGTFVSSASAWTSAPGTFRPGIDHRSDAYYYSDPYRSPDLFDALELLFRR